MDRECAFCGRTVRSVHHVYCEDCKQTHTACSACAEELAQAADLEGYRLVA